MYRWLIVFAVTLAGCVASLPQDATITADLACEGAVIEVQSRVTPTPTPNDDKCENCNGTGKIGDGRIVHPCPACDGTGKKPKSLVLETPVVIGPVVKPSPPVTKPAPGRVPVQNCPDGRCPLR